MTLERRRELCHRDAHVADHHLRHVEREDAFDDERDSTALDSRSGEVVTVGDQAANACEQRSGSDGPRVEGD